MDDDAGLGRARESCLVDVLLSSFLSPGLASLAVEDGAVTLRMAVGTGSDRAYGINIYQGISDRCNLQIINSIQLHILVMILISADSST